LGRAIGVYRDTVQEHNLSLFGSEDIEDGGGLEEFKSK